MDTIEVGLFIKDQRQKRNWTQKELARQLSVSNKAISKWECGRGTPDYDYLLKMSDLFDVPVDNILKNNSTKRSEKKTAKHSYKYALSYVFVYLLFIIVLFKVLDYCHIFLLQSIPSLIDISAFFTITLIVNFIALITNTERAYFLIIYRCFSSNTQITQDLYKQNKKIIIQRTYTISIISVLLFIYRLIHKFNIISINTIYTNWLLVFVPLIYMFLASLFYFTLIASLKRMKNSSSIIKPVIISMVLIIISIIIGLLPEIPQKTTIYNDSNISINLQQKNNSFYLIPQIETLPLLTLPENNFSNGKRARTLSFSNTTITADDEFIYLENSDKSNLISDTTIPLNINFVNEGSCIYINAFNGSSDVVLCSDVHFEDAIIKEKILLNTYKSPAADSINLDISYSKTRPQVEAFSNNNINVYYIHLDNGIVTYIYDSNVWYVFNSTGTKEQLNRYLSIAGKENL